MNERGYRTDATSDKQEELPESQPGHIKPIGPSYPIKPVTQPTSPKPARPKPPSEEGLS